jgi:hypothetical protein
MGRVILIGEAPNRATEHQPRLWLRPDSSGICHSANRLLKFTGWSQSQYLEVFARTNLITRAVDKWPAAEARAAAANLIPSVARVILLGSRVATAFRHKAEPLVWTLNSWTEWPGQSGSFWSAKVPHPSGRNLWWNSGDNRARALQFFDDLLASLTAAG